MRKSLCKYAKRVAVVLPIVVLVALWQAIPVLATMADDILVSATPTWNPLVIVTIAPPYGDSPVILVGDIMSTGGSVVSKRGFVWSLKSHTEPDNVAPEYTDYEYRWIEEGIYGEGEYSYQVEDLIENTDYYGRAVALFGTEWVYGNEVIFDPITSLTGDDIILGVMPSIVVAGIFCLGFKNGISAPTMIGAVMAGLLSWVIVGALI